MERSFHSDPDPSARPRRRRAGGARGAGRGAGGRFVRERSEVRCGVRNGAKTKTVTGPTGPMELMVPRARVFTSGGSEEWS